MKHKIGILGSGMVGQSLAAGFIKHGYETMIGSNNASKRDELQGKLTGVKAGTFAETVKFGQIIILAVKGGAAESVVRELGSGLTGKTVLDPTNPIADLPPVNGVIQFFTHMNESLMERLQRIAPDAHLVKAFSIIGAPFMVNPDFSGVKPTMFICGNDEEAKSQAREILDRFGFEVEDMGAVEAARAIEPLCILWCIPGFLHNRWTNAFKLLKL